MLGSNIMKMFGGAMSGGGGGGVSGSGVDLLSATVHGPVTALWTIGSDGFTATQNNDISPVVGPAWIIPQVGMAFYDVRATFHSGNIPDGPMLSAWHSLSADRTWGFTDNTGLNCELFIEIRVSATGSIIDSATVLISTVVEFDPGGGRNVNSSI